jgi:hypothetical protein
MVAEVMVRVVHRNCLMAVQVVAGERKCRLDFKLERVQMVQVARMMRMMIAMFVVMTFMLVFMMLFVFVVIVLFVWHFIIPS